MFFHNKSLKTMGEDTYLKISKLCCIFILVGICYSCIISNEKTRIELEVLKSKPIKLPRDMYILENKNSLSLNYFEKNNLKLIHYTDSLNCTNCSISKLLEWDKFTKYADGFRGKLKFYFIYFTSDINKAKNALQVSMFLHGILIDRDGEFERLLIVNHRLAIHRWASGNPIGCRFQFVNRAHNPLHPYQKCSFIQRLHRLKFYTL